MEQSLTKIDKIDEETEDDGTYNTPTQNGASEADLTSLKQSRVTLNNENS